MFQATLQGPKRSPSDASWGAGILLHMDLVRIVWRLLQLLPQDGVPRKHQQYPNRKTVGHIVTWTQQVLWIRIMMIILIMIIIIIMITITTIIIIIIMIINYY